MGTLFSKQTFVDALSENMYNKSNMGTSVCQEMS